MKYLEFKPSGILAEYIQLIWILESESPDETYPKERILPDGIIEMVFHYKDPFITHLANGDQIKQFQSFAISQMREFIELESDGKMGFISIRFYPWGAYHFFSTPIKDFIDNCIDLADVYPQKYQSINKELALSSSDEEKVSIIESFLKSQLAIHQKEDGITDNAIKLIRKSKGIVSIDEIADQLQISRKQLERKFVSSLGTTPKVFSRTCRFLSLCHNLKNYEGRNLSELTYECGYFDQSHFIKEFKAYSGFTPKEYFAKNNVVFADL